MKTIISTRLRIWLILFVLNTFSFICFAQNWRSIPTSDTLYFYVMAPTNTSDSIWNSYLRSIQVDSNSYSGNLESIFLPPSSRMDALGMMQPDSGDSWLGHIVYRDTITGEETFYNQLGDSILLKTHALLNDSWSMANDTNGISIQATITNLDTLTIDGSLDSIKTLTLQAYLNATPALNYYNGQKIILSKSHGFLSTFEFYAFPNYDSNYQYNLSFISYAPYPILFFPHARLEKKAHSNQCKFY